MRTKSILAVLILACAAQAKEPRFYQKGTIDEMNSVECGYEEKGSKGLTGVVLGTDSQHKKTEETLCQEYVLRTARLIYRVRPKEEKHPMLLPVGEQAEFRIQKDLMFLRVPESDGKERRYVVVSMTQRPEAKAPDSANASKSSPQ